MIRPNAISIISIGVLISGCSVLTGCGGGGNEADQPVVQPPPNVVTPIPVMRTSAENANLPNIPQVSFSQVPSPKDGFYAHGYAFADLKRNGTFQLIASSVPSPFPSNVPGKLAVYERDGEKWKDITSSVLDDTTSCIQPSQLIVADFNGDKKPDVFVACYGYHANAAPPGEQSRILWSTPTNKYVNNALPYIAVAHSAAAADHTGDGYADIAVASLGGSSMESFILRNNRNGTFTPDYAGIRYTFNPAVSIGSVQYADINKDGFYDLIVSGHSTPNRIFYGATTGVLSTTPNVVPDFPSFGTKTNLVLQTIVLNNTIFYLRTTIDPDALSFYKGTSIECFNTRTNHTENIFSATTRPTSTYNGFWTDAIMFKGDRIVSSNITFQVDVKIPATCM